MSREQNTYSYDNSNNILTVTINNDDSVAQKIFVKPSYEFGNIKNTRQVTPETDYLNILREEILKITIIAESREEIISFENGGSYSTGIYLQLNSTTQVPEIVLKDSTVDILVEYTNTNVSENRRISFEVI